MRSTRQVMNRNFRADLANRLIKWLVVQGKLAGHRVYDDALLPFYKESRDNNVCLSDLWHCWYMLRAAGRVNSGCYHWEILDQTPLELDFNADVLPLGELGLLTHWIT